MQGMDVALYFANTDPNLLTDPRPHPFGDRMIQPLNGAVAEGNFEMLDLLMNWSAPHMDGKQIFRERMTSAECNLGNHLSLGSAADEKTVKYLVDAGVDVNRAHPGFPWPIGKMVTNMMGAKLALGSKDNQVQWVAWIGGMTALHEAAYKGNISVVRALIKHGADPRLRNHYGLTPLEVAQERGLDHVAAEIEEALAQWPAEQRPSWLACCAAKEAVDSEIEVHVNRSLPADEVAEKRASKAISVVSTTASETPA